MWKQEPELVVAEMETGEGVGAVRVRVRRTDGRAAAAQPDFDVRERRLGRGEDAVGVRIVEHDAGEFPERNELVGDAEIAVDDRDVVRDGSFGDRPVVRGAIVREDAHDAEIVGPGVAAAGSG